MKMIAKTIVYLGLATLSAQVLAACDLSQNAWIEFPKQSSISIDSDGVNNQSFNSGLKCPGVLDIGSYTYVKYQVESIPTYLQNTQNSDVININIKDVDGNNVTEGVENDLSRLSLVSLFNGANKSIEFYIFVTKGEMVSPGTYESRTQFRLRWYYSVSVVGVAGIGIFNSSPGFSRIGPKWGSGVESTTNFKIVIDADCRVSTQNISFGTSAFATQLQPVMTEVGIRCSSKTPYTVSLNNGTNANGTQRRLKSISGNNYILYEIFKGMTNQRWGSSASELWESSEATSQAGVYDGKTSQVYQLRAEVSPNNSDTLPAGEYTDTLHLEVAF